jgi:hypothetical protein
MTDKDELLHKTLKQFFTKQRLILMRNIIEDKKPVSIRKLEWFISIYCKKNNIKYNVNGNTFNVYNSYKNEQLKSYSKKYFDFFRRNNTMTIKISDKEEVETTIAQMNFFKWAISNNIIEYVEKNLTKINKEMTKKDNEAKKKIATVYIVKNDIVITFD